MSRKEAVAACEFWTTNVAETQAWGTTRSEQVGRALRGVGGYTAPGHRYWAMTFPRWRRLNGKVIENPRYLRAAAEITRRAQTSRLSADGAQPDDGFPS